ncbi:MAG: hypothetical protein WAO58_11400 [Fimbriimonadaceae bacterium]
MMLVRTPLIISLLVAPAAAMASPYAGIFQWIDKNFFKQISITGRRQLGLHMYEVEGDREAYDATTNFGLGDRTFTDIGNMTLTGKNVFGVLNFNFTLADNRFEDPQAQKISLNYRKGPLSIDLGDVRGSLLNTNRFASFSKQLYGASAEYKSGRMALKAVRSESKGSARTVPIQGNNSAGPYYLGASQILYDSQEIRVDGVFMKPGEDYVINYDVGSITFVNRIIAPTSTIVASFEVLGFNSNRGTVMGAGASYNLGKFGRVGMTAIEQRSGGSRGLSSRLEEFQGYGSSSNWYTLQFEPLRTKPIIVRLNGVIQTEGIHYIFDPNVGSLFRFLFDVPPTSTISVSYTPKPTQTIDGDRRVVGFDYLIPLGSDPRNFILYNQASGQLMSSLNPMSGTARGLEAGYSLGPFEFRGSVRDVPHTFVGIESRTFNRNEKAVDMELTYGNGALKYGLSHNNSSINVRRFDADGNPYFTKSRSTSARAFASYRPSKGDPWTLEHIRSASRSLGQENTLDSTTLSTTRTFGKIGTRFALEHQTGFGPISDGLTTKPGSLSLDTARFTASYLSGPITLSAKTSYSAIEAGGKSGQGSDIGLSASYNPSERFSLQTSYNVSNSGQLATLGGFQNGFGFGFDGNGFSGGGSGSGFATGATDYRLLSVNSNYKLSPRVSLDAQLYQSRSSGSVSTNSETSAVALGLSMDMGKGHLLSLSFDQSQSSMISSSTRSNATSFNAQLIGSPRGPWAYRLGANVLLSGGNSPYQQDSLSADAYLAHKINDRQRASFMVRSGLTRGYLPQQESYAALMYEYRLFENIALVGSYKWRKVLNSDATQFSGAYKATGFDLELSFNFGG